MRTDLCLATVATLWATVVAGPSGATAAEPTSSGTTAGSLSTSGCPTPPSSVARPWLDEASSPACRASYHNILGPSGDILRTWHFARASEQLAEDPFLTAALLAPEVDAIQDQARSGDGVAMFGPSLPGNHGVDQSISERALREIYYPAFEAAVREGGAGAVMCAFPAVNGTDNCENPVTLGELKNSWGFSGTVSPVFPSGQRSVVDAVNAGLDQGNFGTDGADLRQAVLSVAVPGSRLDDMIFRRVFTIFRLGLETPAEVPAWADIPSRG